MDSFAVLCIIFIGGTIIGFVGIIISSFGWAPEGYIEIFGLSFPALVMLLGLSMIIFSIIGAVVWSAVLY